MLMSSLISKIYRPTQNILSKAMNFLKQNREYLLDEAKGIISTTFNYTIKDLYKKDAHRIFTDAEMLDCEYCGVYLTSQTCLFCAKPNEDGIKEATVKNWTVHRATELEEMSVQCMIIMVDLSGSMNMTYPSRYEKMNSDYVTRAIGEKNYEVLRNAIGEKEVCKNFSTIQMLLETGESIRNIAFSMRDQLNRQKSKGMKTSQKQQKFEYISRKEIIQVGITHYVNAIKQKRPNTIMTVVYFNSNIEYPVNNFAECKIIGNINEKTMEELIEAGKEAALEISLDSIQEIGDKLLTNMTKAEADGQTAMTPALAFCLGMATKWNHDLNQIVIVTDGLSNVGVGQTQEEKYLQESKKMYAHLADNYAVKSNCVVNIISFEDCSIGYDVIDEVIKKTGGVPYSIGFKEDNKEKIVQDNTINFLNFEMMTGFCQSTKQFCFDNKMAVKISSPHMTLRIPEELEKQVKVQEKNWVSFDMGVRSVNEKYEFAFILDQDFKLEKTITLKLTVLHQYRRSKKISFIVRQDLLKIKPADSEESLKSEARILRKELEEKIRKKFDDAPYEEYQNLAKKLQKIEVVETIDKQILQRFNKKKNIMQQYDKNIDTITRDKRRIESRRKETYNRRKYSEEDIFQ